MLWWLTFIASMLIGLFGDVAMKRAGSPSTDWRWLVAGFLAYTATGLGWFLLLRTKSLAVFGTLYPTANAVGLVLLGMLVFHEHIGWREYVGLTLGFLSLLALSDAI